VWASHARALCLRSTVPSVICVVGSNAGVPDAGGGQFTVVVRDLALNPCRFASVVVDFSNDADVFICSDQLDPSAEVNCGAKTVRKVADENGQVTFTILGGSTGRVPPMVLGNGGKIFTNGTLIGSPTVAVYNLDGAGGVGAGDLSVWLGDFSSGNPFGRSDFDGSGDISANDLSIWLGEFGSGRSTESCVRSCP